MVTVVLRWDLPSLARDKAWRHAGTEESDPGREDTGNVLSRLLLAVLSLAVVPSDALGGIPPSHWPRSGGASFSGVDRCDLKPHYAAGLLRNVKS